MKICVFGASSAHIDKTYIEKTEALCERLARRGHSLVYGAGASGLMGAAARGFLRGGGSVHGVIPEFFRDEQVEPVFDGCDRLTYTKTMSERKQIMEADGDAFIVVPGGIGTFEEMFEVLTLKQLGRHEKAIALYDIEGYYDELEKFLDIAIERKFINGSCDTLYKLFTDADAIIEYVEGYVPPRQSWHAFKTE